jgi:hypothetical protein
MKKENVIFFRDLFWKLFFVALGVAVVLMIATISFWDAWSGFVNNNFKIEEAVLGELFIESMLFMRTFVFCVMLVPAIALSLMVNKMKD